MAIRTRSPSTRAGADPPPSSNRRVAEKVEEHLVEPVGIDHQRRQIRDSPE